MCYIDNSKTGSRSRKSLDVVYGRHAFVTTVLYRLAQIMPWKQRDWKIGFCVLTTVLSIPDAPHFPLLFLLFLLLLCRTSKRGSLHAWFQSDGLSDMCLLGGEDGLEVRHPTRLPDTTHHWCYTRAQIQGELLHLLNYVLFNNVVVLVSLKCQRTQHRFCFKCPDMSSMIYGNLCYIDCCSVH